MINNKGFTLIECIVFIIIALTGFWILSSSYVSVIQKSASSEYLSIATVLCEKKMEETIAKSFAKITDVANTPFSTPFESYIYHIKCFYVYSNDLNTAAGSGITTNYKNVQVTVNHVGIDPVSIITVVTNF